jgi:hypothetical protein
MEAYLAGSKSTLPSDAAGHPSSDVALAASHAEQVLRMPNPLHLALGIATFLLLDEYLQRLSMVRPSWLTQQVSSATAAVTALSSALIGIVGDSSTATVAHTIKQCMSTLCSLASAVKTVGPKRKRHRTPADSSESGVATSDSMKIVQSEQGTPSTALSQTVSCGLAMRVCNTLPTCASAPEIVAALDFEGQAGGPLSVLSGLLSALAQGGWVASPDGAFINWTCTLPGEESSTPPSQLASHALAALALEAATAGAAGAACGAHLSESTVTWDALNTKAVDIVRRAAALKQKAHNMLHPSRFGSTPEPLPSPASSKPVTMGDGSCLMVSSDDSDSDIEGATEDKLTQRSTRKASQDQVHAMLGGGRFGDGYQGEAVRGLAAREAAWREQGSKGQCHRLTVRLARPRYSIQAHEMYVRYNVS